MHTCVGMVGCTDTHTHTLISRNRMRVKCFEEHCTFTFNCQTISGKTLRSLLTRWARETWSEGNKRERMSTRPAFSRSAQTPWAKLAVLLLFFFSLSPPHSHSLYRPGAKSSCNRIQPFPRRPERRCCHGNEASLARAESCSISPPLSPLALHLALLLAL